MQRSAEATANDQQRKVHGRPFARGVSGNPGGRPSNGRRHRELYAELALGYGGEAALSAIERIWLDKATDQLVRAERTKSDDENVRLLNSAKRLLAPLEAKRAEPQASGLPSLTELMRRQREQQHGGQR